VMPLLDLPTLLSKYISTNNRSFFRCPADTGVGFNYQFAAAWAPSQGKTTNDIPFSCSYYYYLAFYGDLSIPTTPIPNSPIAHKMSEVTYTSQRVIQPCFASSVAGKIFFFENIPPYPNGAHGVNGINLLLVDGHAQFTKYSSCNPNSSSPPSWVRPYNYDWSPLTDQNVQ